jgi:Na+-transporting methylmalonyl-CoA/oxaloacetate decarboxylase beta subunit
LALLLLLFLATGRRTAATLPLGVALVVGLTPEGQLFSGAASRRQPDYLRTYYSGLGLQYQATLISYHPTKTDFRISTNGPKNCVFGAVLQVGFRLLMGRLKPDYETF